MSIINWIRHRIARFSTSQQGGIAVLFVIMVPFMFAIMALYFDSTQVVGKRARLADAMNEGILAIANRGDKDEANNVALLTKYLENYLPEANRFTDVSVKMSTTNDCITYTGHAKAEVNTFIRYGGLPGFDKEINVTYGSDACRNLQKSMKGDFVFIVDMSASMRGKRLRALKVILKDLVRQGRSFGKANFGLVPFGNGVPVRLPGKNERGGEVAGCSVMFVPKASYDIDYQYWSSIRTGKYSKVEKNAYYADKYRHEYYMNYVSPSGNSTNHKATRAEYCVTNSSSGKSRGSYTYSCVSDLKADDGLNDVTVPLSYVFKDKEAYKSTSKNKEIHPTFLKEAKIANEIRKEANKAKNRNIAHQNSIDYQQTLDRLFIPDGEPNNAIMTFYLPWTKVTSENYRTFKKMCRMVKGKRKTFANAKVQTRLIELSPDLEDMDDDDDDDDGDDEEFDDNDDDEEDDDDELDEDDINGLEAAGLTETMSGFMRAVPVLARGQSENKAMIIISDGGDNSNKPMRDDLMDKYGICEKVKDPENYKTYAPKTKRVELFFILLQPRGSHKDHVARWSSCVGQQNVYYAPDSQDLEDILTAIMTKYGDEVVTFNSAPLK